MGNKPLIRPYFWGGVALGGVARIPMILKIYLVAGTNKLKSDWRMGLVMMAAESPAPKTERHSRYIHFRYLRSLADLKGS